jgi:hypothetical protein
MAQRAKIEVTPRMREALDELRKAVDALPIGEDKARAEAALELLAQSFQGVAAAKVTRRCPVNTNIIRA